MAETAPEAECFAGAMNDQPDGNDYPERVRFEIQDTEIESYRRAADFLNFNNADILCVQHEFGIYGGAAGGHLLALLKEVRMPVVTTLHTVLQKPDAEQREVMEGLIALSQRMVVMAEKGKEILHEIYQVEESKIDVIPHGIPDLAEIDSHFYKEQFGVEGRQVLLTFGLLGPGKGIEHVIEALPEIVKRHPEVIYLILGATHPHLVAREGEHYRLSLERLAEERGVQDHVIFHNRYVTLEDLKEFIGATDIYVTPYINEAQVTSGTLAYVFGSGKAVVSTPYWHAKELLADGRGVLVPFADSAAISEGVCGLLKDGPRMKKIQKEAYAMGREMIWPAVAERYLDSFRRASIAHSKKPRAVFAEWTIKTRSRSLPPLRLDHLIRMTDSTGIFQHATFNVPNFHEGYCTDDNARAFILCNLVDEQRDSRLAKNLHKMATRYLSFLAAAFNYESGRFRNFMSHGKEWLEDAGSEDSHARALWAAGTGVRRSSDDGHRRLCAQLFEKGIVVVADFTSPRAWTFSLLGIHDYLRRHPEHAEIQKMREILTGKLMTLWQNFATEDWPWFETGMTYDNARLCQALILGGDEESQKVGLDALHWLVSVQKTPAGCFRPIGSDGFYEKDGTRAHFDQQPVEAQAMVSTCLQAFRTTKDPFWENEARRAFEWFLGRNDLGLSLYDAATGGCRDGLHRDRLNENQGAESTLAFHLSLVEMRSAFQSGEQAVFEKPRHPKNEIDPNPSSQDQAFAR